MTSDFRKPGYRNSGDLSNGYYTHLPPVSVSDFDAVMKWLKGFGIPEHSGFFTPVGVSPFQNKTTALPTEVLFKNGGKEEYMDAALICHYPHVARVELLQFFGLPGADKLVMYEGPRKPVVIQVQSPVGDWWPEQGPNAFRPAPGDKLPVGTVIIQEGNVYRKEERKFAFIPFSVWVMDTKS